MNANTESILKIEYIYFPIKVRESHSSSSPCVAPPTHPHPAGNRISAPDLLDIVILVPLLTEPQCALNKRDSEL